MRQKFSALINGEVFTTKKALEKRAKLILNTLIGKYATGEDEKFLRDLIKRHPAYLESRDGIEDPLFYLGVDKITYGENRRKNSSTLCMIVKTRAGTIEYISLKKCIDNKTLSPYDKLRECFRIAISDQINEFRKLSFKGVYSLKCPISGREVTEFNCHVDHYKPQFKELMNDFIASRNIDPALLNFRKPKNDFWTITDTAILEDWVDYHKRRAVLRILSVEENQKRKKAS